MKFTRTWLLLGAGAMLVANNAASAQARTAPGSGIKVSKEQPTTSTMPSDVLTASDSSLSSLVPGASETSAISVMPGAISVV